ncbi:hypothetical protein [Kineosporia succinea]|uniref:FMN phosphatase YigB (HAD superfamily) n=1 Tax=Kineosporia succinea TaxID=84632 RepID=A0ABT9NVB4_9ACTN|nr:hypothetical protein [Kineosporia succinea]MDP9824368.1 FMN phosphatase YigB (HAD superfamily) [Kineosporia succinea]
MPTFDGILFDLDAVGARDAGLTGVWLNRGAGMRVPDVRGIHVIRDLGELPGLVLDT